MQNDIQSFFENNFISYDFVSVAPRFTNVTGNNNVIADGANIVRLTCRTDSSNPPSAITWYRNGLQIASSSTARHEAGDYGGQVTIQDLEFVASREMDGQRVECRASNELNTEVTETSILNIRCKNISIYPVFLVWMGKSITKGLCNIRHADRKFSVCVFFFF